VKYLGLQSQIWRNNTRSVILLLAFPVLILGLVWLFFFIVNHQQYDGLALTNQSFMHSVPFVIIIVGIWFMIAWSSHTSMINRATAARPLERKENKRVYNLVENLCISQGMKTPKINVIEDDSLNAFASGISEKSYMITLSRGIINKLNDDELESVIAHELTHIQNKDVRLLIISIIFVGIFAFTSEMAFRMILYGGRGRKKKDGRVMIIILLLALLGYLLSILFRFALSRKREYLADAGSVRMTGNALALASSLRKISGDPRIEAVKRRDVAQLFIENPQEKGKGVFSAIGGLFATHPPIEKRIQMLEQF